MLIRYRLLLLFFGVALNIRAQVVPQPGAMLSHTQVMFEYGKVDRAYMYSLQIAEDSVGPSFGHVIVQKNDSTTATLVNNLQFGKKYQWRYSGIVPGQAQVWYGPYHFEIISDTLFNGSLVNMQVTKNDVRNNASGFIVNDCTHSANDRTGKLVWFLQKVNWHVFLRKKDLEIKPQIMDLRLTPYGTATYLADSAIVECDLDGNVLWHGPNNGHTPGSEKERYNHDFKRLPNGDYMVLGNETWRPLPAYKDTALIEKKYPIRHILENVEYAKVEFGTLIEYDKKGKVIWRWNSQDYFDPDPLKPLTTDSQLLWELKAHVNAFSIDKKNEFVYVGFRDISRIIKIEKKTGKVVDSWGIKMPSGEARKAIPVYKQHDANILDDGSIAVFNDNDYPGMDSFARVVIFSQQPVSTVNNLWQFDCNFDSLDRHATRNGGNVDQLKNGNYLVCMGNMNRIFEVTKKRKIVWEESIKTSGKVGDIYFHRLYRAHHISSLYPCYFVFQTTQDTINIKSQRFGLKVFNKGSESDSYQVKISTLAGMLVKQFNTDIVGSDKSAAFNISVDKTLKSGDKILISVSSITNPDFERKHLIAVVN